MDKNEQGEGYRNCGEERLRRVEKINTGREQAKHQAEEQ